jgi:PAS domain S-box-containing protein
MEKKIKILIVEDSLSDAELISYEIKKSGIRFIEHLVSTREEYLKALHDFNPDIILSDYALPAFTGMQALMLRQQLAPSIPFILVTGSINEETAVEVMKAGADDYVIKEHITRIGTAIKTAFEKRDIIRSKEKAEEKLRILSRAIEQNPASIIITSVEGFIEYVNPKFTTLTGYTPDEVYGQNPRILKSGNTTREEYHQLWKMITSGGEWHGEFTNCKKNGEIYFESASICPITNDNGKITHFLAVKEDITEKKKMLNDIVMAKEKAAESDRLKTAFLHNISHEIRTPMNAIVGFSEILNEPGLPPDKRRFFTDIIIQSSNQLLSIITDIINIATIEAGQEKIHEERVDLNSMCEYILEQFISVSQDKNIALNYTTSLEGEDAIVFTDGTKLKQILTNLVGNALKFTQQGHIRFGYTVNNNFLEFYTEDTGIGISPDLHEEVFQRFRQVEYSATRHFGGAGLGLSISKAYIELLGGKIWVNSEPNKGSVFHFIIPLKKAEGSSLTDAQSPEPVLNEMNQQLIILIAEDNDSNFLLLKEMLSDFKIDILRARDGFEAIEVFKSAAIDLVLMDIKMPGMDGYQATKQIKEISPAIPVIAQTAYTLSKEKEKALLSGCDDYITKPIKKAELITLLNKHFNNLNISI